MGGTVGPPGGRCLGSRCGSLPGGGAGAARSACLFSACHSLVDHRNHSRPCIAPWAFWQVVPAQLAGLISSRPFDVNCMSDPMQTYWVSKVVSPLSSLFTWLPRHIHRRDGGERRMCWSSMTHFLPYVILPIIQTGSLSILEEAHDG